MTNRKLDLFNLLNRVNQKDHLFVEKLSEEELKEFQPFVVMRWLTGTNDPAQIYLLNELVNPYAFSLLKHKNLLYKLACVASSGQSRRYKWTKANQTKNSSPLITEIVKQRYGYNSTQARDVLHLLSENDILQYAEDAGLQKEEITKLKKEIKQIYG